MLKVINIDDEMLCTLSTISDSTYAWSFIDSYLQILERKIENDSRLPLNLHCFFLKFSTLLDTPLSRISQSKRIYLKYQPTQYQQDYFFRVRSMLKLLTGMICSIFPDDTSDHLLSLESPIDICNAKMECHNEDTQSGAQFNLVDAVNKISILWKELHLMSENLICLVEVDVKKMIVEQILKDLLTRLENKSSHLFLSATDNLEDFETSLKKLSSYIHSQYHMVECLQDIIQIHGNLIWHQVLSEFFKNSALQEASNFLSRAEGSVYMQKIHDFSKAQTFFGRMIKQILHLTSPSRSMFVEPLTGWFNLGGRQLFGLHTVGLVTLCLGPVGLASLDSLLYCTIKVKLESVLMSLMNVLDERTVDELQKMENALGPAQYMPSMGILPFQPVLKIFDAVYHSWAESLATVGQLQLLRHMVSLKSNASFEVIKKEGRISIRENPYGDVYMSEDPPPLFSRCMCVITISQLAQYVFDPHLGSLICPTKKATDFFPMIVGLGTFINQFQRKHLLLYLEQMGQYVRIVAANVGASGFDLAAEVKKSTFWLMSFCKIMRIPKDLLDSFLTPSLISVLQT